VASVANTAQLGAIKEQELTVDCWSRGISVGHSLTVRKDICSGSQPRPMTATNGDLMGARQRPCLTANRFFLTACPAALSCTRRSAAESFDAEPSSLPANIQPDHSILSASINAFNANEAPVSRWHQRQGSAGLGSHFAAGRRVTWLTTNLQWPCSLIKVSVKRTSSSKVLSPDIPLRLVMP
jgi:hypothetical protein